MTDNVTTDTCGVVIPAYQAAKTVGQVVATCVRFKGIVGVVVVDDGSTDGTAAVARTAGAQVIAHPANWGKGAALITAFNRASESGWGAAITLDADGQHDPEAIPRFLDAYLRTRADIVIGSRTRAGTAMPLVRQLSNRISSTVVSRLAHVRIADSQSGYRLVTRRVWETIRLTRTRYDMESEILIKAGRRGFRIVSIPVETTYGDETSHFLAVRDTARMIRVFLSLLADGDG